MQSFTDHGDAALSAMRDAAPAAIGDGARVTPGPAGLISFDGYVDPLAFLGHLVGRYGDVVRYQTRFGPCMVFVHPEHVQTILHRENYRRASLVKLMLGDGVLASDGPRWRSQRRLMQRDFLPASIGVFAAIMSHETAQTAAAWRKAAANGEAIDVTTAMTHLTLRVAVRALFSDDLSQHQVRELCAAITQTITDLGAISWTMFGVPVQMTPDRNATFAAGKNVIDLFCYDVISRRRAVPPAQRPADLLSMLIGAETDTGPMTDLQLRDEIVTMLVGGHETTALALAWAWKALAEQPELENSLRGEVNAVLGGRAAELADMPKLPWSRAIFQEAMRLYPPVWSIARVAIEDDVVDGHPIPRRAAVLVIPWLTHRHKDFWTDPEKFDPRRFMPPAPPPAHRYAFFPFGGGRHQCLGLHFALMEGTIIVAQLAQEFRLRPTNAQAVKPDPGITLRQSPGLLATVEMLPAQSAGGSI